MIARFGRKILNPVLPFARAVIALCAAGLLLAPAQGFQSGSFRVLGMESTMRTDTTPIGVQIKGERFAVPANYFDEPMEPKGQSGQFRIVRALLFVGLAPDFSPRTSGNLAAFRSVECCMRLLLTERAVSAQKANEAMLARIWRETVPIDHTVDGNEIHYVVRGKRPGFTSAFLSNTGDLYVPKNGLGYTRCNRVDRELKIRNIVCSTFFPLKDLTAKLTYPGRFVAQRRVLAAQATRLLRRWQNKSQER